MNYHRIWAVVIRHIYNLYNSLGQLFEVFYWPAMDIFVWGLTFSYVSSTNDKIPQVITVILSALIFWQIIWQGSHGITVSYLEELWNRNLINFFCSPLTSGEWLTGVIILGIIKMLFAFTFASLLAWLLYAVNLFSFGFLLIPFMISLLMMGWWMGILISAFFVYVGQRIDVIAWAGVQALFPFSAVFYPVSSLPQWAQMVSKIVPASYIFEGMRGVILNGSFDSGYLMMSLLLNFIYLILAVMFFKTMFRKTKEKGLARLQ